MRLICLNTFCGRVREPLLEFLRAEAPRTDIFCLQEIVSAHDSGKKIGDRTTIHELGPAFEGFSIFYEPMVPRAEFDIGQMIAVKNSLSIAAIDHVVIHNGDDGNDSVGTRRIMFYAAIAVGGQKIHIFNMHGISRWPKTDSWEREAQSFLVRDFMDKCSGPKILCGDFNLEPTTESVEMLKKGMRSLTDEYGIKTTRGRYREFDDHISDYMIVSPEIKVFDFQVPDIVVSDHLPLILDFEL